MPLNPFAPRRDPNVAIGGHVYALTALTAIRLGCMEALRERLLKLGERDSPFARVEGTHFARLVVIDRLPFEGPLRDAPIVRHQYLLFSVVFDGDMGEDRDAYLTRMCERIPETVEGVWSLCLGAPEPATADPPRFASWLAANQVKTRAFYAHYADATVGEVRDAIGLHERVWSFAVRTQYWTPGALQQEFAREFPIGPRP
jgi:hypothetical protein